MLKFWDRKFFVLYERKGRPMKHAFLIIAHKNLNQVAQLIHFLDHENNEIFIHIDSKVSDYTAISNEGICHNSKLHIYQHVSIVWGGIARFNVSCSY